MSKLNKYSLILILCSVMILMSGCLATRTLNEGEYLYKGGDVKIKTNKDIDKLSLKNDLDEYIIPEPNKKLFGFFPLKLYMYSIFKDSVPKKSIRNWMKNKAGQPPVLFEDEFIERSNNNIINRIYNVGYYDAEIKNKIDTSRKKIKVRYLVDPQLPYTIDTVMYDKDSSDVFGIITSISDNSLLNKDDIYKLSVFKDERERINRELLNKGYYYFSKDFIKFQIDSNQVNHTIKVLLKIKKDIPPKAYYRYHINLINVYPDYTLEKANIGFDTIQNDGISYYDNSKLIRYEVLSRSILFNHNDAYSYDNYTGTLNKLMGLGVYKFVNINFSDSTTIDTALLNANIFLSPRVPKSFRLEFQAASKSNDLLGPSINLNFRDRNLNRGAEMFLLKATGGFETQLNNKETFIYSYDVGFDASLTIPRFVSPFYDLNQLLSKQYTPKTTFRINYNYFDRFQFFTLNNVGLTFEYNWRETELKSHNLEIFSLNYTKLSKISKEFRAILDSNLIIKKSFEEQFIFSLNYGYLFNNQMYKYKKINTYFNLRFESAGSSIRAVDLLFSGGEAANKQNNKFLGLSYSQFLRGFTDLRFYVNFREENMLVGRLFTGVGFPFGNSGTLPYVKQFSSGGARSLRGFQYRSVGPGGYIAETDSSQFFDQTGNVKLELNLEYRFKLVSILNGALFTDIGNIWYLKENKMPNSEFNLGTFYKQLAVSAGVGLRLDASILVLRFDLGIPIRYPYSKSNNYWVFNKNENASNRLSWDNMILNISVGYPF